MRLIVGRTAAGIPEDLLDDRHGRVATTDFLARAVAADLRSVEGVSVGAPQQEVLERTSVAPHDAVEARITVQLPASGRRGRRAQVLPSACSPRAFRRSPRKPWSMRGSMLRLCARTWTCTRDQETLRDQLEGHRLVASSATVRSFLDAPVIPTSPLPKQGAVPFTSPDVLRVSFDLPSGGASVTGMGVPEGVTVIVGGGYPWQIHAAARPRTRGLLRMSRATGVNG